MRLAALGATLATVLALAACGKEEPRMPLTCTSTDAAGYERALRAAPGAVRLTGGTPISACLRRVRGDAELQELGAILHPVAEHLAARVRDGADVEAARQLGYLNGAVGAGADRSNGISSELARRIATAGSGLDEESEAVARALQAGQSAGVARG